MSNCADNLSLPTLLVRGGLSNVLSEAGAQSFLAQCPHAEYVNVENAAHMVAGFNGVLTRLTDEQADYIHVKVDGPYKPDSYRY